MVINMARNPKTCPICGFVSWKEDLDFLDLTPSNTQLLGEKRQIHLCSECLAGIQAIPESERWLYFLELILHKSEQPIAPRNTGGRNKNHSGQRSGKK